MVSIKLKKKKKAKTTEDTSTFTVKPDNTLINRQYFQIPLTHLCQVDSSTLTLSGYFLLLPSFIEISMFNSNSVV